MRARQPLAGLGCFSAARTVSIAADTPVLCNGRRLQGELLSSATAWNDYFFIGDDSGAVRCPMLHFLQSDNPAIRQSCHPTILQSDCPAILQF